MDIAAPSILKFGPKSPAHSIVKKGHSRWPMIGHTNDVPTWIPVALVVRIGLSAHPAVHVAVCYACAGTSGHEAITTYRNAAMDGREEPEHPAGAVVVGT